MKPMGDVKVKKLGGQLLINIPRDVVEHLKLKPGKMNIVRRTDNELLLEKGSGPVKVVDVGRGKLRLYISMDKAPFKNGDRVLITTENNKLTIKRINYYIAKPTVKPGSYKINLPWELVESIGLDKHSLVKIYSNGRRVIIEPLEEEP